MRNPFMNPFKRLEQSDERKTRAMVDWDGLGMPYGFGPDGMLFPMLSQTLVNNQELVAPDFVGFVWQAYMQSPVVFACIANRMNMFSEARFQYRRRGDNGRPGDLFGDPNLSILENPWVGGTTGDLLGLAELYNSLAGNFFAYRDGDKLRVMRPDWTWIVLGSDEDEDVAPYDLKAEVIGYLYNQGGLGSGRDPVPLLPEQVCHWAQTRDPLNPWRGMSWLTPVIQEILADKTMTQHKRKYLEAGATPNLAINLDPGKLGIKTIEDFDKWVEKFQEKREGRAGNPYRTLFLAAGADPIPIGANLQEVDFQKIQSIGETRIAAAAMVHPAIVGFMEGLQGSALNAGNLAEAFRQFANTTIRPNWRGFCSSLSTIVVVPAGAELWYDDRDIPALQEDTKKRADIAKSEAETVNTLITAGYLPDSVIDAVVSGDLTRLKGKHSGLFSVQLQPAGAQPSQPPASKNGAGTGALVIVGDISEDT